MRLSYALLVVTVVAVYSSGSAQSTAAITETDHATAPNTARAANKALADAPRILRVREDVEKRGWFGSTLNLAAGAEKLDGKKIKAEWLNNADRYDEIIQDVNKLAQAFAIWKSMGYSSKKVETAMKAAGKYSDEYKFIVQRYKAFHSGDLRYQ